MDNDDEVRDRATYCLEMLARQSSDLKHPILEGSESNIISSVRSLRWRDDAGLDISFKSLEYSLQLYLQEPGEEPFSLNDVVETAPDLPEEEVQEEAAQKEHGMCTFSLSSRFSLLLTGAQMLP